LIDRIRGWGLWPFGILKILLGFLSLPLATNGEGLYLFASSLRTTSEVSREPKSRKKDSSEKQNKALTEADNLGYHVRPTETKVVQVDE